MIDHTNPLPDRVIKKIKAACKELILPIPSGYDIMAVKTP